jgi:hypothetical protein
MTGASWIDGNEPLQNQLAAMSARTRNSVKLGALLKLGAFFTKAEKRRNMYLCSDSG